MNADVETVSGVLYAYALQVIIYHGGIVVIGYDVIDTSLVGCNLDILDFPSAGDFGGRGVVETYLDLLAYVCAKVNGLAVISPTESRGNGDVSELGPCGGTFFANRNFNVFHNVSNINHDIVKFEHVYSLLKSDLGGSFAAGQVENG